MDSSDGGERSPLIRLPRDHVHWMIDLKHVVATEFGGVMKVSRSMRSPSPDTSIVGQKSRDHTLERESMILVVLLVLAAFIACVIPDTLLMPHLRLLAELVFVILFGYFLAFLLTWFRTWRAWRRDHMTLSSQHRGDFTIVEDRMQLAPRAGQDSNDWSITKVE